MAKKTKRRKSAKKSGPKRRKSKKTRRKSKSIKRKPQRKKSMAKKKKGGGKKRGGVKGIMAKVKSVVKPTVAAIGGGILVTEVARRVFPQAEPIAELAGQFTFGGIGGTVGAQVVKAVTGQGSILDNFGGFFGGGGGQTVEAV